MFNSADGLHLAFQEPEERFLVLIPSYPDIFHCGKPTRVYIDSAIHLGSVLVCSIFIVEAHEWALYFSQGNIHLSKIPSPNLFDLGPSYHGPIRQRFVDSGPEHR